MSTEEEITKLFKVRRTVLEMLRDRGYSVEDSDLNMRRRQFIEKFGSPVKRDDLFIHTNRGPNPTDQIYVFFPEGQKVGVPVVKSYVSRMKGDSVFCAIVVAQLPLTAPAKAAITQINACFRLEVFQEAELLYNITEHMLVPKHSVLDEEEKKALLDKYGVKETQLPRILITDPVAKYFGLRRGQVVKIIRESVTSEKYITYRYAV